MKRAKKTAVCGMVTALSVVLMATTTILPVLMYTLPIITGLLVLITSRVAGFRYALGVYFATSFLCLVLITDKEAALTYTLFFGYYTLVKYSVEKLPVVIAWFIKLLLFNTAAVLIGFLSVYLFGVSGDDFTEFGKFTVPILLGISNVCFVLYDYMITKNNRLLERLCSRVEKSLK